MSRRHARSVLPNRRQRPRYLASAITLIAALWLSAAQAAPLYPADALVFVSTGVVDQILSAADDSEYQLPGLKGASLRIIRVRNDFANHPGQLRAELQARLPQRKQPLRFTATASLRPDPDPSRPGLLLLRPELLTLNPELNGGLLENAVTMMAAATVRGALNTLANAMPALDFALQRQIRLAQAGASYPLEFRIGQANVNADLLMPALAINLRVSTRELRFSPRGAFALLDIGPAAAPLRQLTPAAAATKPGDGPGGDAGNDSPSNSPGPLDALIPADTQTLIHIRGDALARLAMVFNTLPQQDRTLTLYSTWSQGKLFARKRLGLGCGAHGRLINPGAVVGGLSLGALQAQWRQQRLTLQLPLWVELETQARVSINGFPAPCGLSSPRPRCRCARGKTRFQVQSRVSEPVQLFGAIAFSASPAPASGVRYAIALSAPDTLALSPRLQLGRIGSLSVPARVPMPIGEVAQGALPLLLEQAGRIKLGMPPSVSRDYQLRLKNSRIHSDASGLSASFSLTLEFSR